MLHLQETWAFMRENKGGRACLFSCEEEDHVDDEMLGKRGDESASRSFSGSCPAGSTPLQHITGSGWTM